MNRCNNATKSCNSIEDNTASNLKLLQFNWQRTLHVGLTGFTFSGPISHAWYGLLEGIVGSLGLASFYSSLATKMLLDAAIFSPVAVAGYFVWRSVLDGSDIRWKLEHKWIPAVQASWSFWPLANVFNFGLVPLPYRVLYNNCLSLAWNAYLSNVNQTRLEQVVEEVQTQKIPADNTSSGSLRIPTNEKP